MPAFADLSPAEVDALIAFLSDPEAARGSKMLQAWKTSGRDNARTESEPERYWSGYGYMRSTEGLPEITAPWTTLTAYDLDRGTIKWQVPLGEMSTLAAKGIRNTGSATRGGVVVTAGGLIFAGTQDDHKFRAYDKDTGEQLWETEIPARPNGVPAVFEVDGRQYVVICATEAEAPATDPAIVTPAAPPKTSAQGYYVFALPVYGASQKAGHP
jgi:quinoprotein glucose dehydrogenase